MLYRARSSEHRTDLPQKRLGFGTLGGLSVSVAAGAPMPPDDIISLPGKTMDYYEAQRNADPPTR